jgi:hypothetical protein
MTNEIMRPTINLNSTAADDLVNGRMNARRAVLANLEARRAVLVTLGAIGKLSPNGRDYIGQPDALARDQLIHRERFRALDSLYNALEEEAIAIQDATP